MELNLSPTVVWAILGLLLIVAELISLSFVLIFFGIAALVVAVIKLLGFDHLTGEVLLFSLIGLSGVFLFRGKLLSSIKSNAPLVTDVNQQVVLSEDIPVGKSARILYQGTTWNAHNAANQDLKKGDAVLIEKLEGINLYVNTIGSKK